MLTDAISLGLSIYKREDELLPRLIRFREEIDKSKHKSLLDFPVEQIVDEMSWHACDPDYSNYTIKHLHNLTYGTPILFLALAHGGVAPGMDNFLRYCDSFGMDSSFYAVRFSRDKSKDSLPRLNESEIIYLKEKAKQTRKVVIFDEDISSGETKTKALNFFKPLFDSCEIFYVANFPVVQ